MSASDRPLTKAYVMGNLDGRRAAMVAARNLDEAAKKMRTSAYSMRQMGWSLAENDDLAVALAAPDTVFYRPITNIDRRPWTANRQEAL